MLSSDRNQPCRRGPALLAVTLALAVALALSGTALAAPDTLSGGSVTLRLQSSKKLKLKPASLNLAIAKGKVDPVTGAGTVDAAGTLRAKSGKAKAKVQIISLTFGASGGPGQISAKVGKKTVEVFATLSGGTTTRQGFGANLSGISAKLGSKGAKALNKAFSKGKKKKGAASAAAKSGVVKGGLPLGTVSATTIPKTLEVLPGGGMTLHTNPALLLKLLAHCVDGAPGAGGAYPIPPATQDSLAAGGAFRFPVVGGALAPDFSDGKVLTAGGQGITKNISAGPCALAPAVGTTVLNLNFSPDFLVNLLYGQAVLPGGTTLDGAVGSINFNTGTRTFDPATKKFTVTGATVTLNAIAADTLNNIFPNRSGMPSNDFSPTDTLGTIDLTGTLR